MENQEKEIRIYVACLAAYNNGILHGCWIKANQEPDEIKWQIYDILKMSPIECAEEYAIHDFEGFEGVWIEEYASIDRVADIAAFIEEHGALGGKLVEYFGDVDEARDAISDRYHGCYSSLAEFAEEITQETTSIPDSLRFYIDYEAMARDLAIGDVLTIETGFEAVHVFWSN
jgi:antirestriction protein